MFLKSQIHRCLAYLTIDSIIDAMPLSLTDFKTNI